MMYDGSDDVWVRHERSRVWHLTTWAPGRQAIRPPDCGARAIRPPAWLPWLGVGLPPVDQWCRTCLHHARLAERDFGRARAAAAGSAAP